MSRRFPEPGDRPAAVVALGHNSAAEALGISPTRLRQHVRMGEVTVHFSGTKPIYLLTDLEQFVEQLPTRPNRLPRLRRAGPSGPGRRDHSLANRVVRRNVVS
jgi:hypothetical protein